MRFLIAVLVAAIVIPLAVHPAEGTTTVADSPSESAYALARARLEDRIVQAQAARNAALLGGVEGAGPGLAEVAAWLVEAAATLGITISEVEAEALLATAATEQGGTAAVQQALLDDARLRVAALTARAEDRSWAPPPPVPPPAEGAERWRDLIARYFPLRIVDEAVKVMQCESEGDPTARNRRSGATGLFQFLGGTWEFAAEAAGVGDRPPTDPEANIAAAAWLVRDSEERGIGRWAHWTCRP